MRAILTATLMTLATQAGAVEIVMACGAFTYKYTKSIWGATTIQYRVSSPIWQDYCDGQNEILYFSGKKVTCDSRHTDNLYAGLSILDFKSSSQVSRINGGEGFEDIAIHKSCIILKNR